MKDTTIEGSLDSVMAEAVAIGRTAAATGKVASYIPELAKVDPNLLGIALCPVDGPLLAAGDADTVFTMQSVSKVFFLAHAIREQGPGILDRMSCEPSGDSFHSIVRLEEEYGRPRNPYINAGAIMVAGLLPGSGPDEKVRGFRAFMSEICDGAAFPVDEAVYQSESNTGFRNRALANYMRHHGIVADADVAVETYFRLCAVTCTATRLARAGLFLANRGVDPLAGKRILDIADNRSLVALMATCGMYDEVGRFAIDVGLPGKSSVSGSVLSVVPGRLSIAVFAPALGPKGNSVGGLAVMRHLSTRLDLSLFG
jgi:glutaminase